MILREKRKFLKKDFPLCAFAADFCYFYFMLNVLKGRLLTVRLLLAASMLTLIAIGILTIYSIGNTENPQNSGQNALLNELWQKQAQFAAVGILAFAAVNAVNYRRLGRFSYWIYAGIIAMLTVLLLGKFINIPFVPEINGTHRWIRFSIAGKNLPAIQPSELCKLGYVIALAWYLRYRSNYRRFSALIGPFLLTLLPMIMILLEPDLGTVMLMMPVLFVMLFIAGAKVKHLTIIVLLAIIVSPLLWQQMNSYQRIRISSVLLQSQKFRNAARRNHRLAKILFPRIQNPSNIEKKWQNDWGFHLIRSKYALASGGLTGQGFRKGPFVKYDFLPERHNDFIFAIIAHQWGFIGCLVVLALYAVIVTCGLEIAANNTDPFARLLALGIVAVFTVEVIVNVSMTMGLMPITGLTLPFISYGGSSLVVSMTAVGLLNNIGRRRPFTLSRKPFE